MSVAETHDEPIDLEAETLEEPQASEEPKVEEKPAQNSAPVKHQVTAGHTASAIIPTNMDEAYRLSTLIARSGLAPSHFQTPESVAVAVMHGLEVGLPPMSALKNIAVINGRPAIWGDALLGLVMKSGLLEDMSEETKLVELEEGSDIKDHIATCTVKRKGMATPVVSEFSMLDAKQAGLTGKSGPWKQYPMRMLKMRARAFALRDAFPDVLGGLHIAEEARDYHDNEATQEPEMKVIGEDACA